MDGIKGFSPLLTTKDWNEEWIRLQDTRRKADDPTSWDERAKTFHKSPGPSPYVDRFIDYADLDPADTVFDMGCGNGALAIPLARQGHEVIAADFSRGMLDSLEEEMAKLGPLPIDVKQFSWADDWADYGVTERCVDKSIASRSIATHDLKAALEKLSATARKGCCITLPTGSSPRVDGYILSQIGLQPHLGRDFAYAFMILLQLGYLPEVRYIPSIRRDTYDTVDQAYESLRKMVNDAARNAVDDRGMQEALASLERWLAQNITDNPEVGEIGPDGLPQKRLMLKTPRKIDWAFISWSTDSNHR